MASESQPVLGFPVEILEEDRLLLVEEAAHLLGVSKAFVYAAAESSQLRHVKVGRLLRFRRDDIADYIASRSQGGEL